MTKYCKCGCGTEIADDKTWAHGHHTKGKTAHNKGVPLSAEAKQKMSDVRKGKTPTIETRKKISDSEKGKIVTAETKQKLSDSHKGKTHTAKTKQKISAICKGRTHTTEAKQKMSAAKKGKLCADETKRAISATKQGITYDEWESYACKSSYCPKFNEACKESNREKYGRECFICGKSEKDNGSKLSVHHVNMDKAQGCESNWKLVPLCKSCHSKSHNDEIISRLGYLLKV